MRNFGALGIPIHGKLSQKSRYWKIPIPHYGGFGNSNDGIFDTCIFL